LRFRWKKSFGVKRQITAVEKPKLEKQKKMKTEKQNNVWTKSENAILIRAQLRKEKALPLTSDEQKALDRYFGVMDLTLIEGNQTLPQWVRDNAQAELNAIADAREKQIRLEHYQAIVRKDRIESIIANTLAFGAFAMIAFFVDVCLVIGG
jgi:hypothetical protein